MKLYFKQKIFSWLDSYDVYDESGEPRYFVKGKVFSIGHQIHVFDKKTGAEVGAIKQRLLTLLKWRESSSFASVRPVWMQ